MSNPAPEGIAMIRRTRTSSALFAVAAAAVLGLTACAGTTGGGSEAPSGSASAEPDAAAGYVTEGKLTIATGEPAYYPWVIDDKPESGEGFEAAVAYAVAEELGFAQEDVVWVRTTFEEAIAPGPKEFDFNLQQFAITDERKQSVDFSSPYYETTQVVVTAGDSPAADATSIADLKPLLIGAQTGTTSLAAVESAIAPDQGAQVFNTNDDAKLALSNGQVDAIVVDLPTAFFITSAELQNAKIVGQLPAGSGTPEQFGAVLDKGSPLTSCVSEAVEALRSAGTLAALEQQWLTAAGSAPELT
jgi:polar amino acid transport system substrate-binding protein